MNMKENNAAQNMPSLYKKENLVQRWHQFMKDNVVFIGMMLLFSLPYCSVYEISTSWKLAVAHVVVYLARTLLFLFGIAFLTYLLQPQRLRLFVRASLLVMTGIISAGEIFFLWRYGSMPDAAVMEIVIATNPQEAIEFVQMYLLNAKIALGVIIGGVVLWGGWHVLRQLSYCRWTTQMMTLCFAGAFLVSTLSFAKPSEEPFFDRLLVFPQKCFPIGYAVHETMRAAEDLSAYETILNGHTDEDIVLMRNEDDLPYVIFIQGESTSRHHMSVYGYPLETTPHLDARKEHGELVVFTDVISPHSHTMPVMEKIYTFYRNDMPGSWYEKHNLFDILHVAGIHTAWISNQEPTGVYGNAGRVYASKCDVSRFTRLRSSQSVVRSEYDSSLLPILDDILNETTEARNFFVVHLMGTHVEYAERYPREFAKFSAEDETLGRMDSASKKLRAEYDNAVLYNDDILDKIIQRFEDKDAIVIYISDHAEEVMEDRDYAGHDETKGTHWMIEIPMVVWTSKRFREQHPDRMDAIKTAAQRPYMTDDMIHSLLDLLHIETDEYHPERSVFSRAFDATRERTYHGRVYEKGDLE